MILNIALHFMHSHSINMHAYHFPIPKKLILSFFPLPTGWFPDTHIESLRATKRQRECLEHNQVELRKDTNNMKGNIDHMLEVMLAQSKNTLQHIVTENVGSSWGFTIILTQCMSLYLTMILHKWTSLLNPSWCHWPILMTKGFVLLRRASKQCVWMTILDSIYA